MDKEQEKIISGCYQSVGVSCGRVLTGCCQSRGGVGGSRIGCKGEVGYSCQGNTTVPSTHGTADHSRPHPPGRIRKK